ncbi:uncharacterized protein TRIVIDRAFT_111693 [Trichoderma virens Gv29-8]|uniref:Uncharacterized protein n=2 Tax=Trichoderma TaxID=5543 RepID=G9N0S3_HYPVG|nr:uncharacterized protein TRIVIDRAFT_111693 [Trichoderma virens Gv29-8]EHK19959.1 hypothetical protein TRIVIDRAFT_111693 [Trichoderma virens Gv29-8]PNP58744.1 hypothetical protein THARTR1_01760 [Trichoderma harzianum]
MVSFKVFAILPYALAAAAAATSPMPRDTPSTSYLILRTCVPPTNCGAPVGNCEFCCAGRKPNSNTCHSHGGVCPDGTTEYHCDDATR